MESSGHGMDKPTIAIIGAGAVGGYYGARLALRGYDVHFLLRGDYDAVRRVGWTVRSCAGDFTLPADRGRVYERPGDMPRAGLVVTALKAPTHAAYEPLVGPLLGPETAILALQNGLG